MAKKKASANYDPAGSTDASDDSPRESPSFEEALSEAKKIVSRLEGGDVPLAQALKDYESGISRLQVCQEILQTAENTISVLSGFDADGNPVTEPMPTMDKPAGAGRGRAADRGSAASSASKSKANPASGKDLDDGEGLF